MSSACMHVGKHEQFFISGGSQVCVHMYVYVRVLSMSVH